MKTKEDNMLREILLEAEQLESIQTAIADAMEFSPNDICIYVEAVKMMSKLLHIHMKNIKGVVETI